MGHLLNLKTAENLRADHHGETVVARKIAGARMLDNRYASFSTVPQHLHDHAALYYVRAGEFEESLLRRAFQLDQGSFWFRPANEPHSNRFGRVGARCLVIELPNAWLKHVSDLTHFPAEPWHQNDVRTRWIGTRLCEEMRLGESAASLAVEGLLLELAAGVSRRYRDLSTVDHAPRWLTKVEESLRAHYRGDIRLSQLAALVEIHPVHLARVFRKRYGCTLGQYVRRLRVEYARAALANAQCSIAAIALDAGFSSQAHFSNVLRNITGISPARYRAVASNVGFLQKASILKDASIDIC